MQNYKQNNPLGNRTGDEIYESTFEENKYHFGKWMTNKSNLESENFQ